MHADRQPTGSEPSGIEYVQQHKHGHDFTAVSIPRYNIEVLTLVYLHHIHGCPHKLVVLKPPQYSAVS